MLLRPGLGTVQPSETAEFPVGGPWYPISQTDSGAQRWLPEDAAGLSPCFLQPSLFVLIGEEGIAIAGKSVQLAADVISVDDRPVKGGGLPDFWQSNLTRVIRSCLLNPNIQEIFVVGETKNAGKTLEWLRALACCRFG
jgi:hypothetical protein